MELKVIGNQFTVCKVSGLAAVDFSDEFCFLGKTDEELSLVCSTSHVPPRTLEREDGWRAFRVQGVLDFSLVGILSQIATILADNQISIFAVSTFHTDYVLVKDKDFEAALSALRACGYSIVG